MTEIFESNGWELNFSMGLLKQKRILKGESTEVKAFALYVTNPLKAVHHMYPPALLVTAPVNVTLLFSHALPNKAREDCEETGGCLSWQSMILFCALVREASIFEYQIFQISSVGCYFKVDFLYFCSFACLCFAVFCLPHLQIPHALLISCGLEETKG